MRVQRLLAMARKEFLHVRRDRRSLGAALGIPLAMMCLYCYSLSLDVNHLPTLVLDQSQTQESHDLVYRFASSGYFDIRGYVTTLGSLQTAIDRGDCRIGLVFPYDFARRMKRASAEVPLQVVLDGSDPARASVATGYVTMLGANWSQDLLVPAGRAVPIEVRPRVWYNPSLDSKCVIIPGMIAMIMAVLAAFLTSLTLSREWENGTMELLISTPVTSVEVVVGKLVPYFCIGLVDTALIVGVGWTVFGVAVKGSLLLLTVFSAAFLVGMLGLGLWISAGTRSQLASTQIALLATYLPTMLLSGFVFFLPSMPVALQALSVVYPARYFITALKGIYLKASGLQVLSLPLAVLLLFDVTMLVLACRRFVKKLEGG